ncbi:MAG: hypothetical protein ACHQM6_00935 [Candidatus Kapaibacterium sp.]
MKHILILLSLAFFFIVTSSSYAKEDYLKKCWGKQGEALHEKYLLLSYKETVGSLYHSMTPWQTYRTASYGSIWINAGHFFKHDTLKGKKTDYYAATEFDPQDLLMTDFGDTTLETITQRDIAEYTFETARYSPALLIHYFLEKHIVPDKESNSEFAVYKTTIGKTIVSLFIRKKDCLPEKVSMLAGEDILGDVTSIFHYADYSVAGNLRYARTVRIEKKNGKVRDTITISAAGICSEPVKLLKKPAGFVVRTDVEPTSDSITVEKFSDHIHFVTFKHADSKAMIVEFEKYLVVAESPLSSANGELLIHAASEIAPQKPVKYFAYGHWHPWYLGGVRPFIHHGANIICAACDSEYIAYLATAQHTLEPDQLQLHPTALHTQLLRDSMTISDGKYSMSIYLIGKESDHTQDYSIFYFPQEKMIFEGDLAWIKKDAAPAKADSRQAGLYNSIKERHLDVTTVVQSWPVTKYGLKSTFQFAELEEAMKVK